MSARSTSRPAERDEAKIPRLALALSLSSNKCLLHPDYKPQPPILTVAQPVHHRHSFSPAGHRPQPPKSSHEPSSPSSSPRPRWARPSRSRRTAPPTPRRRRRRRRSAPPASTAPKTSNSVDNLASILGLLGTLAQAKAAQPPSDKPGKFDGAVGQLLAKLTGGSPDLPALLE